MLRSLKFLKFEIFTSNIESREESIKIMQFDLLMMEPFD